MHLRNNERDKFMEVMRFPENIGLVPVVIFSIGVTYRLIGSVLAAAVLRFGTYMLKVTEPRRKD